MMGTLKYLPPFFKRRQVCDFLFPSPGDTLSLHHSSGYSESLPENLVEAFRKSLRQKRQDQAPQQPKHRHNHCMASSRKWVELGSGPIRVCVIKGDLTTEQADVIICAASRNLDLSKGRMSKSMLEAAGQEIQNECKSKYPHGIGHDEIADVKGGKMKCKRIYFVALPLYGSKGSEEQALKNILTTCIETAHRSKFTSIALPALGTGFLKYPADVVSRVTLESLEDFNDDNPGAKLRDISVIVYYKDTDSYQAFVEEIRMRDPTQAGSDSSSNNSSDDEYHNNIGTSELAMPDFLFSGQAENLDSDEEEDTRDRNRKFKSSLRNEFKRQIRRINPDLLLGQRCSNDEDLDDFGLDSITEVSPTITANSIGNISVNIVLGKLAEFHADVIVNNTSADLKLDNGALAESLLRKAGPQLQQECKKEYPNGIKPGEVAVTGGYSLNATKVYHGAIPKWEKGYSSKKILCKFVCACLEQANSDSFHHIAFPALGTGSLKFPLEVTAKVMIKCITEHETNFHDSILKDISIVVFDGDKNCQSVKSAFDQALADARTPHSVRADSPPLLNNFSSDFRLPEPALNFKLPLSRQSKTKPSKTPAQSKPSAESKRGSTDWFKYQYKSEPTTPSYWTVFHSKKTLKDWHVDSEDIKPCAVPVDMFTFNAVKQVVQETWKTKFVGHGRDAQGLGGYSRINVKKVERIENSEIFEKYYQKRQEFFHKAVKVGAFKTLESVKDAKGGIETEPTLSGILTKDLYPEINEHYLFHGTRDVRTIINQGLDTRLAGSGAMFGPGIYFAESSTKADQYADTKSTRSDGEKKMFLVRVCLGEMYVQQTAKSFARPPCRHCQEDKCSCESNDFYHAVIGDGTWNFREFVVYDRTQVYPEYVITYVRV